MPQPVAMPQPVPVQMHMPPAPIMGQQPNNMQPFAPTFVPTGMPQPVASAPADPFAKFEQDALNRKQNTVQQDKNGDNQNYYDDEYGDDDYYNEDQEDPNFVKDQLNIVNQLQQDPNQLANLLSSLSFNPNVQQ